jgi:capsule synthesis protein PGA_cap
MYLPELVPLPWRILKAWERFLLSRPRWTAARDAVAIRDEAVKVRLMALGDVALIPPEASDALGNFDALKVLLGTADICIANLEAVITSCRQAAVKAGSGMRADPEVLDMLTAAGFELLNAANNHALDYGSEGLADCLRLLSARAIGVCGVEEGGPQRWVTRVVNSIKIGFLGFCDDLNTAIAIGTPRPSLWSRETAAALIAAARRQVDVVIVLLHWGYEFSLHPLRRHRDEARRVVEAGAQAVICHHAHVPQGFEIWKGCPIVYGLGNGFLPMGSYLRDGHPWVDRSYALELGLVRDGVATMRLHPLLLGEDGSPAPLSGGDRRALLHGVSRMSARLSDDVFLDRCERARLTRETVRLASAILGAAAQGVRTLEERVALLDLPRQQALIEFLTQHPQTAPLARALRALAAARQAGNLRAVTAEYASEFSSALERVRELYRWRDALRARVP